MSMPLSLIIAEHYRYLADQVRLSAFQHAICEVVREGDVVLDLGSGTGILGLLACQAGARRVYSIENNNIIELARKICSSNNFIERFVFIKGLSTKVELPEKVDVVVADQIGFGSEFGLMEYYADAKQRFLKYGGAMLPSRIGMCVAPVESSDIFELVDFWTHAPGGFDFRPVHTVAANTSYRVRLDPEQLLATPVIGASHNLADSTPEAFNFDVRVVATRSGTLHGISGWFSAQLSDNISISNSPLSLHSIDRDQVFYPLDRPIIVHKGDKVRIKMHIIPVDHIVTWSVSVEPDDERHKSEGRHLESRTHSTWKGKLISQEDLRRTRPDFVPLLTPYGEVQQFVLSLCNGKRSLAEIEREVYTRYHDLFSSPNDIGAFVVETIGRFTAY